MSRWIDQQPEPDETKKIRKGLIVNENLFQTGSENNMSYPYKAHRTKIDNSYLPGWVYLKEKMEESS